MWVPASTTWRVLRVAGNVLDNELGTADKGWFSSLGVGLGANDSSPLHNKHGPGTCEHGNGPAGCIRVGSF
jgi:hypothetical protein